MACFTKQSRYLLDGLTVFHQVAAPTTNLIDATFNHWPGTDYATLQDLDLSTGTDFNQWIFLWANRSNAAGVYNNRPNFLPEPKRHLTNIYPAGFLDAGLGYDCRPIFTTYDRADAATRCQILYALGKSQAEYQAPWIAVGGVAGDFINYADWVNSANTAALFPTTFTWLGAGVYATVTAAGVGVNTVTVNSLASANLQVDDLNTGNYAIKSPAGVVKMNSRKFTARDAGLLTVTFDGPAFNVAIGDIICFGEEYNVCTDKVILLSSKLTEGANDWYRKGIFLDYEVQDSRTTARTTALITALSADLHAVDKQLLFYTNPLSSPIQVYTGLDSTNIPVIHSLVDLMTIFIWSDSDEGTVPLSYEAQLALLEGGGSLTDDQYDRLIINFEMGPVQGSSNPGTTIADCQYIYDVLHNPDTPTFNKIIIWRNFGTMGGTCDLEINQKLCELLFGISSIVGVTVPWPVGVTTRNISFSPGTSMSSGEEYETRVLVTCNGNLTHNATGLPMFNIPQVYTDDFVLPVTNLSGVWRDEEGILLTSSPTHTYNFEIQWLVDGTWKTIRYIKELAIVPDAATLDIDMVVSAEGWYAPPPALPL